MKRYRLREQMNGIDGAAGQGVVLGARSRRHRRRPLHPVRHLRGRVPVELHRDRRGHRPARTGQDVHRLLPVLGLLPPGRAALRGAVAAVDRVEATRMPKWCRRRSAPTRRTPTGRSAVGRRLTAWARWSRASPSGPARRNRRRAGRRRRQRAADRAAGRRRDRRRPGLQAERGPRRAVEGHRHHRHHGGRDPRRLGQLLQPDHGAWPSSTSRSTTLPAKPRIAVVGTPCEVQGLRAMQARRWPTGAHRVDAVVLSIALMCTKNFDYEALTLRELRDKRGVDLDRVSKMDVIRGRMIVEYRDGELAVDEPVKDFHGAALKGCDECADFLGRSADISVGSVGSMDGLDQRADPHRARAPGLSGGPVQARRARTGRPGRAAPAGRTRQEDRQPHRCSASSTPTRPSSSTSRSTCAPTTAPIANPSSSAD